MFFQVVGAVVGLGECHFLRPHFFKFDEFLDLRDHFLAFPVTYELCNVKAPPKWHFPLKMRGEPVLYD